MLLTLCVMLFVSLENGVSGEIYESPVHLQNVLEFVRDSTVPVKLQGYVKEQTTRLWTLRLLKEELKRQQKILVDNKANLYHPAVIFKFLYSTSQVVPALKDALQKMHTYYFNPAESLVKYRTSMPTALDNQEFIRNLIRMSSILDLDPTMVAMGTFNGFKSRPLTTKECMDIATTAHSFMVTASGTGSIQRVATAWLEYATKRTLRDGDVKITDILTHNLMETIRVVFKRTGCECSTEAINAEKMFIKKNPGLNIPPSNVNCKNKKIFQCKTRQDQQTQYHLDYCSLCQGKDLHTATNKKIKEVIPANACRYTDNGDPRLKLSPVKLEELNLGHPYVVLYHNILTDQEMTWLKELGKAHLKRGEIHLDKKQVKSAELLLEESGFLLNETNSSVFIRKLWGRFEAIRPACQRLSYGESADLAMISNHNSGVFHYNLDAKHERTQEMNNTIATIIVNLDDAHGGETVFPMLNIRVPAEKGKALLFYNLHDNGKLDIHAAHETCPIVYGDKWTYTQWVTR